MFEIGFWELVTILVIGLLVLGPERLPEVARSVGRWVGNARAMARSLKGELDRELAAEELKRVLEKQAQVPELHEIIEETRSIGADLNQSLQPEAGQQPAPKPTLPSDPPGQHHDGKA